MCIAVMLPCFQSSGRLPSSSDLRSRMSSGGVSASATSLSTRGCHPSDPGDLLGFSFFFFLEDFIMINRQKHYTKYLHDKLETKHIRCI